MSKSVALVASVLCFLGLTGFAHCHQNDQSFIEGKVYCDSCNVQFMTRLATFIEGAMVRMECRCQQSGEVTYSVEGKTCKDGGYRLPMGGDPAHDFCEVKAVWSPNPDCNIVTQDAARVGSTHDIEGTENRHANNLRFMRKQPLSDCADLLKPLYASHHG